LPGRTGRVHEKKGYVLSNKEHRLQKGARFQAANNIDANL
jgi:hypothetical protein